MTERCEPMLRLSRVACLRGGRMLFAGLDLYLGPGDAALLIGPNGIGKSSLLRLAAGLLPPFSGSVERSGQVAMTDERLALEIDRSLGQALGFWAKIDRATPAARDAALDAMALGALRDVPVRMLSTGQRKRAMLARVVASGAPIWLLDEPGNGLDADSLALLARAIDGHLARGGLILAASHQPLPLGHAAAIDLTAYQTESA